MKDPDLSPTTLSHLFADEDTAREFIESELWPNGPVCPHCGNVKAYALKARPDSKKPVRAGVYKCAKCRKQFTVRVGTIFEHSHIPLRKWLMAMHLMTGSKRGVSSHQISREVGTSIQSAWFLTHRIRKAMEESPDCELLAGAVGCGETYVGGKPSVSTERNISNQERE